MRVGVVGVGEMGAAMAGHLVAKGHRSRVRHRSRRGCDAAATRGIGSRASSLEDLAKKAELFVVIVIDRRAVAARSPTRSRATPRDDALIVIAATNGPMTMKELDKLAPIARQALHRCAGRLRRDRREGGQRCFRSAAAPRTMSSARGRC